MQQPSRFRLARIVKRILDALFVFTAIILVVAPIVFLVISIDHSRPGWGADVQVYTGFEVQLDQLDDIGNGSSAIRNPEVNGKTDLSFDTSSRSAWFWFVALSELTALVALYGLMQLRALFSSLQAGDHFARDNPKRIQRLGFLILGWSVASPLLSYFIGKRVISDLALNFEGFTLYPAFQLPVAWVVIGLALLVLAGVLDEARRIQNEQELTI